MPNLLDCPFEILENIIINTLRLVPAEVPSVTDSYSGLVNVKAYILRSQRSLGVLRLTNRAISDAAARAGFLWIEQEIINLMYEIETYRDKLEQLAMKLLVADGPELEILKLRQLERYKEIMYNYMCERSLPYLYTHRSILQYVEDGTWNACWHEASSRLGGGLGKALNEEKHLKHIEDDTWNLCRLEASRGLADGQGTALDEEKHLSRFEKELMVHIDGVIIGANDLRFDEHQVDLLEGRNRCTTAPAVVWMYARSLPRWQYRRDHPGMGNWWRPHVAHSNLILDTGASVQEPRGCSCHGSHIACERLALEEKDGLTIGLHE